jgi:hypothetical protein
MQGSAARDMLMEVGSFALAIVNFVDSHEPFFVALFTLALALFTWLLAKRTGDLWRAGEKQIAVAAKSAEAAIQSAKAAKASAEALTISERAHVFVVIDSEDLANKTKKLAEVCEEFLSRQKDNFDNNYVNVDLELKYAFRNYGRTPAILNRIFHDLRPTLADEDERFQELPALPKEWIIASGATSEFITCPFVGKLYPLQLFERKFYFSGSVEYRDIFGGLHVHRFSWEHDDRGGEFTRLEHDKLKDTRA